MTATLNDVTRRQPLGRGARFGPRRSGWFLDGEGLTRLLAAVLTLLLR